MDLQDRIDRRLTANRDRRLVADESRLSPVVHLPEPIGRGSVLEQLLDELEPVFGADGTDSGGGDGGRYPSDFAVVGPPGAGKSAVVTALFGALNERLGRAETAIGTTTRSTPERTTRAGTGAWFVPVDARRVRTSFAFYRTVLSVVSSESVPESGVGTDDLRNRLCARLESSDRHAVIAIDHYDEAVGRPIDFTRLFEPIADRVTVVVVCRAPPDDWTDSRVEVEVPPYRRHELVDVLAERASAGLATGGLDHESLRRLATWADGNAHDALAALFGAATLAAREGNDRIESRHLEAGMADVPEDGVHLDRVLALSKARQRVLRALLSNDLDDRPVRELATQIAAESESTAGTVTRFLYELADDGVLERTSRSAVTNGRTGSSRSSALSPRFPSIPFCELAVPSTENSLQ